MTRALAAAVVAAGIVFAGVYVLNELVWGFIPFGSSVAWASVMALVAGTFTLVDQIRHG